MTNSNVPLHIVKSYIQPYPVKVNIDVLVPFLIVEHSLRRNLDQKRVIGTLVGVRSEDGSEIEVKGCFAVPHNELSEQVEVDMEHHRDMISLYQKANPREYIVGWYATSHDLNTFSALIQNFYCSQANGTHPHSALHLTMDTNPENEDCMSIRVYISSNVGTSPERISESCLFVPVPFEINSSDTDKAGLKAVLSARNEPTRTVSLKNDIQELNFTLNEVLEALACVSKYVDRVLDGSVQPDTSIGKLLLETLSVAPNIESDNWEKMFNMHMQDMLMVTYLSNIIRTQLDITGCLNISN